MGEYMVELCVEQACEGARRGVAVATHQSPLARQAREWVFALDVGRGGSGDRGERDPIGTRWEGLGIRTFELFVELASRGDGKGADELLKVDCAVAVFVKYVEDIVCELGGITKGEELLVDAAEFLLVELAIGTVS